MKDLLIPKMRLNYECYSSNNSTNLLLLQNTKINEILYYIFLSTNIQLYLRDVNVGDQSSLN